MSALPRLLPLTRLLPPDLTTLLPRTLLLPAALLTLRTVTTPLTTLIRLTITTPTRLAPINALLLLTIPTLILPILPVLNYSQSLLVPTALPSALTLLSTLPTHPWGSVVLLGPLTRRLFPLRTLPYLL